MQIRIFRYIYRRTNLDCISNDPRTELDRQIGVWTKYRMVRTI